MSRRHSAFAPTLRQRPVSLCSLAASIEDDAGIRFNERDASVVDADYFSEGWIRVPTGKSANRKGQSLRIELSGRVEALDR